MSPGARPGSPLHAALAAYGAPLSGCEPPDVSSTVPALEEVLVDALRSAHADPTILRVLPLVVARNAASVRWTELADRARAADLVDELGMVVDLAAELAADPSLGARLPALGLRPSGRTRAFFAVRSSRQAALAEARTPPAARRWGFLMNFGQDAFRSLFEKFAHAAP